MLRDGLKEPGKLVARTALRLRSSLRMVQERVLLLHVASSQALQAVPADELAQRIDREVELGVLEMAMTVVQRTLEKREQASKAPIEVRVLDLRNVPRMLAIGAGLCDLHEPRLQLLSASIVDNEGVTLLALNQKDGLVRR